MSRPTVPPDDMTDDGYHIVQTTHPVTGFHPPSKDWERLQTKQLVPQPIIPEPYVPTAEEKRGDSWEYCYGAFTPILPPLSEERNEPHQ